jgi:hypothetical protein
MRTHAPHLSHWVTRLWKTRPADLEGTPAISNVPDDLGFFFVMLANDYLPYLEANSLAVAAEAENVTYTSQGVGWEIPSAPYRAECLTELKRRSAALGPEAARDVADWGDLHPDSTNLDRKVSRSISGQQFHAVDAALSQATNPPPIHSRKRQT